MAYDGFHEALLRAKEREDGDGEKMKSQKKMKSQPVCVTRLAAPPEEEKKIEKK